METIAANLNGYTDLPAGKLAFVVTYLEMARPPLLPHRIERPDARLEPQDGTDLDGYRALFRAVGTDWLWFSRLVTSDEELSSVLSAPSRERFVATRNSAPAGLLELDFTDPKTVELAYFGLVPAAIGTGLGRWLMTEALTIAWSRPQTERLWVHTCTADSPQAIRFYQASGFRPYRRAIEIADDPRLHGLLPLDVGTHVPVIGARSLAG